MYLEKRKIGKNIKYYLVHSYREKSKVEKIRRYLGSNLGEKELEEQRRKVEKIIKEIVEERSTKVFFFRLSKKQVELLNREDKKIDITHLNKKEWKKFTEEFVYNTNAIEGSTVREEEVPGILEKQKPVNADEMETKGVANAVEYMKKTKEKLSLQTVLKLHKVCFESSKSFAGKFRDVDVVIRDYLGNVIHAGVPKEKLYEYLNDLMRWYQINKRKFKPLTLAAIMHNQFEHIHPFQDGNGRVGRLLLNCILVKNKYPPINITLEDRQEYYRTLQEYSKNGNLKPTIKFLIKQYKKTLRRVSTKKEKS